MLSTSYFPPSKKNGDVDSDSNIRHQVYAEQVAHLYGSIVLPVFLNLLNGVVILIVDWSHISKSILLSWYSMLMLTLIGRSLLVRRYHRAKVAEGNIQYWEKAFIIGVASTGTTWGAAAFFLFPAGADAQVAQLCLLLVLAGMSSGAVPALAARLGAYLAFALPVLLSLTLRLLLQGGLEWTAMGLMTMLFLIGIICIARRVHTTIANSLILCFDNRELMEEINDRQTAEEALFREKERLQITLAALAEGVVITSSDARIEYLNPAAEVLSGWQTGKAEGKSIDLVFPNLDEHSRKMAVGAVEHCLRHSERAEKTALLKARDGREKVIQQIATPLRDRQSKVIGAVVVLRDITAARKQSRQLAYQASHDGLTQLPNRTLLWDRLNHAIAKAIRADYLVAVLFMDLDRFKNINDSLGHVAGDELLKAVALRLQKCVREQDTVARLGGDEFVVILENLHKESQASMTARKVATAFAQAFHVDCHEIFVTASIGITLFPRDGEDAETLLKNADTAMYRTKEQGRNNVQFYAEEMNARALEKLKMEHQLRLALDRRELDLHFQPQIVLDSGKIAGVEALLRWRHPSYGLISPNEFIPIAEETGLILKVGEWVLGEACRQARDWHQSGYRYLRVAVNLSARQIREPGAVETISKALSDASLAGEYLELEITESLFLEDIEGVLATLHELKSLGVKLAIDDFGTGYSSLRYLKRFPIDVLKIDREFVRDMTTDSGDAAIASSIIAMAHGMNLTVIAEGVENQEQVAFLKKRNCDGIQGFYHSKPLTVVGVTQLLSENDTLLTEI